MPPGEHVGVGVEKLATVDGAGAGGGLRGDPLDQHGHLDACAGDREVARAHTLMPVDVAECADSLRSRRASVGGDRGWRVVLKRRQARAWLAAARAPS